MASHAHATETDAQTVPPGVLVLDYTPEDDQAFMAATEGAIAGGYQIRLRLRPILLAERPPQAPHGEETGGKTGGGEGMATPVPLGVTSPGNGLEEMPWGLFFAKAYREDRGVWWPTMSLAESFGEFYREDPEVTVVI